MAKSKKDRIGEHIEEAARRYFEFTLYDEPLVSPEGTFREVTGRLPTAEEAEKVKKRIMELESEGKKKRKGE